MIKKALFMMFFVMCIATVQSAEAEPCTCGSEVNEGQYAECTSIHTSAINSCMNIFECLGDLSGVQACLIEYGGSGTIAECEEEYIYECDLANGGHGTPAECEAEWVIEYENCLSIQASCLASSRSEWIACTNNACN